MPLRALLVFGTQILCGIHAVRTDRISPWLYIIIFLGPIGSGIYFFTQILLEFMDSRAGRKVTSDLSRAVNPDKDLREKIRNLDMAETTDNMRLLAEECIGRGKHDEAADLYERALQSPFETDPALMMGLARAKFGQGRFDDAAKQMDDLREYNPDYQSSDGHLLYARALEGAGRLAEADHEYSYLINYYPGEEARVRYGLLLVQSGDRIKAREMFQEVVARVIRGNKYYYRAQSEWHTEAKRQLRQL